MSTRANVIIKDNYGKLYFYRHSDGYPEGIMPSLEKFLALVKDGKIRDNVSQSAGWLIMVGAEEYKKYQLGDYADEWTECKEQMWADRVPSVPSSDGFSGWKVGAFEPTTGLHGDIAYLYVIDLEEKVIKEIPKDEWTEWE